MIAITFDAPFAIALLYISRNTRARKCERFDTIP